MSYVEERVETKLQDVPADVHYSRYDSDSTSINLSSLGRWLVMLSVQGIHYTKQLHD